MSRLKNRHTGVIVNVGDDLGARLGEGWECLDESSSESDYSAFTVPELREEIEDRNSGRDDDGLIPSDGLKADLVKVLEEDDAANG